MPPRVSVLIPTFERPELVPRAVASALAQTLSDLEVLVLVDGADRRTLDALAAFPDPRLRLVPLAERRGQAAALNAGAALAAGRFVAFLDDDDEWMPEKLELQVATAERSTHRHPIVACRFRVESERGARVWPRRLPRPGEPLSEYLFRRRSPFFGEGVLLTSTLLTTTALLRRVPFDPALPRHGDLDWALRATADPEAGLSFVPGREPLATWHADRSRTRVSNRQDWAFSRAWIERRRAEVTARAYASFLLTSVAAKAVRQGCRRALPGLARDAFSRGTPEPMALLVFAATAVLPRGWREALSHWATRGARVERGVAG